MLRLPSRTLFGSPFSCFSDHDSNEIEFMGQSCKLRWKRQVYLRKPSEHKLASSETGRVCPRLQMSCCSLESNITWIQVACPLLLIGPVVGDYRGSTCLNHRGGGWPSRVAESWNWTTPLSLGGQSASQRTRSSGPDTPVCNQAQGPVITVCSHFTSSAPPRPPPVIFANICHIYTFSLNSLSRCSTKLVFSICYLRPLFIVLSC